MKYTLNQSDTFKAWLRKLKDSNAKIAILKRMTRAEGGNLGDHKSVRPHLYEMRIDVGKGYRVYFTQKGKKFIFLLHGGIKKTQDADIAKAQAMLKDI